MIIVLALANAMPCFWVFVIMCSLQDFSVDSTFCSFSDVFFRRFYKTRG